MRSGVQLSVTVHKMRPVRKILIRERRSLINTSAIDVLHLSQILVGAGLRPVWKPEFLTLAKLSGKLHFDTVDICDEL